MKKKLLPVLLLILAMCSAVLGISGVSAGSAAAGWDDPDNWKGAPGYGDNTVVRQGDSTLIIGQRQPDDFAATYVGEAFYLDGFTARFTVNKPEVDGNLKFIFTDKPGWYTESNVAFTMDFQQGSGNTLQSVTQNIKYPGGGNEIGRFKGGNRNPVFYWDGSQENVFQMYFKEDGLLYFAMNGTEFDSSADGLDTQRLQTLGILDYFINGKGYLSFWAAQVKKTATLTITAPFETMDEPVFADAEDYGDWQLVQGEGIQTAFDGARRLAFRSKEGASFAMKRTTANAVDGLSASVVLGMEQGKAATLFFDSSSEADMGKQLRVRIVNSASENVVISLFDGNAESELTRFSLGLKIANPPAGNEAALNASDLIEIQLKRVVGDYYILRINGEQLLFTAEESRTLGAFLSGNFTEGATFGFLTEAGTVPAVVKTAAFNDLSSGAPVEDWTRASESDPAVLVRDGEYVQMYSSAEDGSYRVYNNDRTFWLDRIGLNLRVQANRPEAHPFFRMVLANAQGGWYEELEGASAVIIEFVCAEESTQVNLYSFVNGSETPLATGFADGFSWEYGAVNQLRFGMTMDGWSVIVNEYPAIFESDFQQELNVLAADFEDSIAYLGIEGGSAPETSITVEGYTYMIEAYSAPRGWGKGHYLVQPQWGEKGDDEKAAFTTPGGGYTVETSNSVPVVGFRMVMKATPGSVTSYATFALNSAHSDWYNTSNAIGFLLFSGPGQNLNKARIGLMVADAARGIQGIEVFSATVDFNWYRENTIEIRQYRGEYGFYVNGKSAFEGITNTGDGNRGFHEYMSDLYEKFYLNRAKLQVFGDAGDMTFVVTELNEIEPKSPPTRSNAEKSRLEGLEYRVGEEISIDLGKLYTSKDNLALTFEASIGTLNGSVWTYTPDQAGTLAVTIKCTDSEGQAGLTTDLSLNVTDGSQQGGDQNGGGCGCGKGSAGAVVLMLAGAAFAVCRKLLR